MPLPVEFQNQHLQELVLLMSNANPACQLAVARSAEEIKLLYQNYSPKFYRAGIKQFKLLGQDTYVEAFYELLLESRSADETTKMVARLRANKSCKPHIPYSWRR